MGHRLDGKVAIVTGGARGIGYATASRFAREGASVVIADVDRPAAVASAATIAAEGGTAIAIEVDVADQGAMQRMVEEAAHRLGPASILINNAGINVYDDPLTLTAEAWRRCFAVDLDGAWHGTRAVLPGMLAAGGGAIVNVASVHSFQIIPHFFPYPVAKHGLIGLTRALAVEYADRGIRVNAVCPSYIRTQICVDYFATFPDPAVEERRVADLHPAKRLGTPEEVAAAILFLASDECPFITGESLMIDGGRSILYHEVS